MTIKPFNSVSALALLLCLCKVAFSVPLFPLQTARFPQQSHLRRRRRYNNVIEVQTETPQESEGWLDKEFRFLEMDMSNRFSTNVDDTDVVGEVSTYTFFAARYDSLRLILPYALHSSCLVTAHRR